MAESDGFFNISFSCYFQLNEPDKCIEILLKNNQIPQAALFSRTYYPSKLEEILNIWNSKINQQDISNRTSI